jgi:PqqA peptide cyclase
VREIWFDSEGFNRYRGTAWMKEPCVSCDQREIDLGGCRCQAYLIANDPAAADPVCHKSPHHAQVQAVVARAQAPGGAGTQASASPREQPIVFRDRAASLRLSPDAAPTISR